MARIRTIKPEFFAHEDLFQGERETGLPLRLAYAGLWTAADREGRFKWKPMQLKTAALPYDDVDFSRVLDALATRGFIFRYEISGVVYGVILSWKVHQFINNKEPQSLIPPPPQVLIDQEVDAIATRRARDFHASVTRGVKEGKGKEGKGREQLKPSAKQVRGPESPELVLPVDSRHMKIKSLICNAYEEQNGAPCPWDGSEGRQLKAFLDATPKWVDSQVAQCLIHMYASAGFAKGTRPREFLPRLPKYLHGPLNEFNREQRGNGYVNKGEQRQSAANDAIKTALKRMAGKDFGESEGSLPLLGHDGGNSGDLPAGNGLSGDRSRAATAGGSSAEIIARVQDVPSNRGDQGQGSHGRK